MRGTGDPSRTGPTDRSEAAASMKYRVIRFGIAALIGLIFAAIGRVTPGFLKIGGAIVFNLALIGLIGLAIAYLRQTGAHKRRVLTVVFGLIVLLGLDIVITLGDLGTAAIWGGALLALVGLLGLLGVGIAALVERSRAGPP